MPLPQGLGRFNRHVVNPLVLRFAGRVPLFAVVDHAGRVTGEPRRTPVMAFRRPDGFVVALVYGRETDWARNLLAAGGATLEHRGRRIDVADPRVAGSAEARQSIPAPLRLILRLLNVDEFLLLRPR